MATKYKSRSQRLAEASEVLRDAIEEIDCLAIEMEEWRDNTPDNLQGSDKYSQVEECADALRQALDEIESAASDLETVNFPGMFG